MLINVKIDSDSVLNALIERVKFWTDDGDVINLYEQMYQGCIDSGVFESVELNINSIVDNDYINWCSVIDDSCEEYEQVNELYNKYGCNDISCDNDYGIGFIEAEYNGMYLVRC